MKKQIVALISLILCLMVMVSLCVPSAFALVDDLDTNAGMSTSILSNSGFASPRLYLIIGLSACVGLMLVFYMESHKHS
ncbi:MAG: hypothetical protein IJ072_08425 [Oscillospiraceae bacterium]|nr:hypothetical protein [Oscillospiraceae bacterium]